MTDRWFTVEDVAKRYQVPRKTIYRWNHRGTGPQYIRVGKHVRYSLLALQAWEQKRGIGA
ncbi:helix-turn-helix transcriptional regulator [Kocuria sp. CPCC 205263]|uniref:helix-turn-helix transcriptional regulator n=1 Tax=Kocuria sp. CPCC 205263 TaxID=3073555 RepID=UPI0034D557B4